MTIPSEVEQLTAVWFSEVLDVPVSAVDVVDAHSGTTGRALVRLTTEADTIPDTLFVKLQPFDPVQRELMRQFPMGASEARLYSTFGSELPVRIPRVWHADFDADGSFVMVLEDLAASGCRFPDRSEDDLLAVATSTVEEMAKLHAAYHGKELVWPIDATSTGDKAVDAEMDERRAQFIQSAVDQFADEMSPAFRRLGEVYVKRTRDVVDLFAEGPHTLVHGDSHIGNLFVDGGRTGFYDWAMASRAPGMRDVAYFAANSLPTDLRRAEERSLLARYRDTLASRGVDLDERTAEEQYRLFSVYSWTSATSTAAAGSRMQPIEIGRRAMQSTTDAVEDLDAIGLLEDRLGTR